MAFRNHLNGKGDDPRYYKSAVEEESKKSESKPFERRIIESGLETLVSVWRRDYSQTLGAESPEFIEQIENVLTGISNGYFGTSTPDGLKEIDEAFRAAMKEVPF